MKRGNDAKIEKLERKKSNNKIIIIRQLKYYTSSIIFYLNRFIKE